ncbi:hypothetical protein Patl1_16529 [Pistacia atlantica]|uniref:Uncharacterized protein n=1 Tax=Pistacia atlantica TaxID=434234 RepID=A0ACC1B858_9ROSI|nr:hypothetical protein Patl1_16529 [Pistacia atlantica]
MHLSCKTIYFVFLILVLIIGSCSAIRPHPTMFAGNFIKYETGFEIQDRIFNFLPKGTPIPPSGPSKRHNAVVDSTPPE